MNEFKNKFIISVTIAVIIAAGLIASIAVAGGTLVEIKGSKNCITVTGSAKKQITSDLVIWDGYFSASSPILHEAYTKIAADKKIVLDYLIKQGIPKNEIVFSSVSTYTTNKMLPNGQYTNELDYYTLSQNVSIRSKDINKITDISRSITELINDGVNFQSNSPQYIYTKLADVKIEVIAEAAKDAKKRASVIAENSGNKIGNLLNADMGVLQITPQYSTEISDMGMNDTSSVNKEITAVIHCKFKIE